MKKKNKQNLLPKELILLRKELKIASFIHEII